MAIMVSPVDEQAVQQSEEEIPKSNASDRSDIIFDPDVGRSLEERAQHDKQLVRKIDLWLIP